MTYNPGDILLDKYQIENLLGQGSFGDVYKVTHLGLSVTRAIKVLMRDAPGIGSTLYSDSQGRFQLEAKLGAKLNSPTPNPYLLQVHDVYISAQLNLLEMDYASGGSLAKRIQAAVATGIPIPVADALRTARQIALALAALHERDIVHRDLKPANILMDDNGCARLADLGLVQIPHGESQRSQLSAPPAHPGTPQYMSPEQENSLGYLGPASDIYALGVTLFEMLTGRGYRSQRPGTLAGSLRADIPAAVDQFVARMLSKAPEDRPWNGAETADLLDTLGKGQSAPSLEVVPPGPPVPQAASEKHVHVLTAPGANVRALSDREEYKPRQLIVELADGVAMEFVHVKAGPFIMGSEVEENEKPVHNVTLEDYLIGKYPVTNRQFAVFTRAVRREWQVPEGRDEHPVVDVTWYDAREFCDWLSQLCGCPMRLPSEAEWEKAARGTDGCLYPWGDAAPDASNCNYNGSDEGTTPVGTYSPQGDSPYGCADMVGNVWEWCNSEARSYPYTTADEREQGTGNHARALRGGSWNYFINSFRTSDRSSYVPSNSLDLIGFRCARSK